MELKRCDMFGDIARVSTCAMTGSLVPHGRNTAFQNGPQTGKLRLHVGRDQAIIEGDRNKLASSVLLIIKDPTFSCENDLQDRLKRITAIMDAIVVIALVELLVGLAELVVGVLVGRIGQQRQRRNRHLLMHERRAYLDDLTTLNLESETVFKHSSIEDFNIVVQSGAAIVALARVISREGYAYLYTIEKIPIFCSSWNHI